MALCALARFPSRGSAVRPFSGKNAVILFWLATWPVEAANIASVLRNKFLLVIFVLRGAGRYVVINLLIQLYPTPIFSSSILSSLSSLHPPLFSNLTSSLFLSPFLSLLSHFSLTSPPSSSYNSSSSPSSPFSFSLLSFPHLTFPP